ncbi:MAG: hypothetical protein M1817_001211 [Caeruleum heppii]|nr:MAG: hypothetical protein M1817_001211 [Caeruleum heppii]
MHFTRTTVLSSLALIASAQDLTSVIAENENLTRFSELISQYADVTSPFAALNRISVIAPSNAAFDKLQFSALGPAFANNDTDIIRSVIEYHIINGTLQTSTLTSSPTFLSTYLTNDTYSNVTGGSAIGAVKQAGNVIVLLSGLGSRSTLTNPDIPFEGGTIQIVDTLCVPPEGFLNTSRVFNLTAAAGAVAKAELSDSIENARDVTIFAPNNDAFTRIGSGLAGMSVEEVRNIIGYHVVNGTVNYSSMLQNNTQLQSLSGRPLTIYKGGNALYVNNAQLLQQDILLSNGVLHVIENVLNYNATSATPNPQIPSQPPIIPGTSVFDIPFTSDLPSTETTAPEEGITTDASGATITDEALASSTSSFSTSRSTGFAVPTGRSDSGVMAAVVGGAALLAAAL